MHSVVFPTNFLTKTVSGWKLKKLYCDGDANTDGFDEFDEFNKFNEFDEFNKFDKFNEFDELESSADINWVKFCFINDWMWM